ncbi:DinB family protein [Flavobacterium sp. SM2513]|uniref:DinB family protein n=1 Tax=Flavobacterium sp. SM2513 TaxID=3424766 RepID=UPI003D7F632F
MKYSLLLIVFISNFAMAQNATMDAFLEKWNNSKNYLLEVAQAMPEEFYDYKPTEREMTFSQQLLHIKENMDWLSTTYFTDQDYKKMKVDKNYSKEETIALLEKSFDSVFEIIKNSDPKLLDSKMEFFAGPKSKIQILNLLQDHVTHHRGQLLVYLNLNDVKPPKYVGW